jgi:hypothetical protein
MSRRGPRDPADLAPDADKAEPALDGALNRRGKLRDREFVGIAAGCRRGVVVEKVHEGTIALAVGV